MKKLYLIIIILTALIGSSYKAKKLVTQETKLKENIKVVEEFYDNGNLKSIGHINRKVKIGEWIYYHENGALKQFGYYKDGLKTAEWQTYSKESKITNISYYGLDNKVYGWTIDQLTKVDSININTSNWEFKFYYSNGQLQSEGTYKDGYKQGLWKSYYENGELKSIKNYNKYELVGKNIWYYQSEDDKDIHTKNKKIRSIQVYPNDTIKEDFIRFDKKGNKINTENGRITDFYITNEQGDTVTNYTYGDTIYLVIVSENKQGSVIGLNIPDKDYEGSIHQFHKVKLYNSSIDDLIITSDIQKIKLIHSGKDPDAIHNPNSKKPNWFKRLFNRKKHKKTQ